MIRRLLAASVVAVGLIVVGPIAGPTTMIVRAHSLLVSSTPGAGEVVTAAPAELRLVFSEALDPRYSSLDLLDGSGRSVLSRAGAPDSADPRILVASAPALPDGTYTVSWRALSATDGHVTNGFFTFGVGNVALAAGAAGGTSAGALHAGHTAGQALLDTQARTVGYLGFMLGLGLAIVAAFVLRPARRLRPGLAVTQALGLACAGIASVAVGLLAGMTPGLDPVDYVVGTRAGELLLARGVAGLAFAAVAFVLVRSGRTWPGVLVGGVGGATGLVLLAVGGHAAAYASPVPIVVLLVHLTAAATWLSGLLAVTWLVIADRDPDRAWVPEVVSRFSALALVSVALVGMTGVYASWVQTRDPLSPDTPYGVTLWVKVGLFVCALVVGGLNFIDGGRSLRWLGGLRARLALEAVLGIAVLVATATLAAGSPPAQERPIALAQAPSGGAHSTIALAVLPGRPGPNRFTVQAATAAAGDALAELDLLRVDAAQGGTKMTLRRGPASPSSTVPTFIADGGALPASSTWDATVVVRDASGTELDRARFTFALDDAGITSGAQAPPIDPVTTLGALMVLLGLLGATFAVAGGSLPRVERRSGRGALAVSAAVSGILGIVLIVGPPL